MPVDLELFAAVAVVDRGESVHGTAGVDGGGRVETDFRCRMKRIRCPERPICTRRNGVGRGVVRGLAGFRLALAVLPATATLLPVSSRAFAKSSFRAWSVHSREKRKKPGIPGR